MNMLVLLAAAAAIAAPLPAPVELGESNMTASVTWTVTGGPASNPALGQCFDDWAAEFPIDDWDAVVCMGVSFETSVSAPAGLPHRLVTIKARGPYALSCLSACTTMRGWPRCGAVGSSGAGAIAV